MLRHSLQLNLKRLAEQLNVSRMGTLRLGPKVLAFHLTNQMMLSFVDIGTMEEGRSFAREEIKSSIANMLNSNFPK